MVRSVVVRSLLAFFVLGQSARAKVLEDPEAEEELDQTEAFTSPSPLEDLGHKTGEYADRARAAVSDATAASAEVYARINAENAEGAEVTANGVVGGSALAALQAQQAVDEAQSALGGATAAAAAAQKYFDAGSAAVAAVEGNAKTAGADGLKHMNPLFKKLADWKWQMNHDPVREATKAGQRAAKPFNDALMVSEKRAYDFEQRAKSLSGTAGFLRTTATATAGVAVGKQVVGDTKGAATDMKNAHQMVNQALFYDMQANMMIGQAKMWSTNIPTYMGAAQTVAQAAQHKFASSIYSPPGVAPGLAGLPPPTGKMFDGLVKGDDALVKGSWIAPPVGPGENGGAQFPPTP